MRDRSSGGRLTAGEKAFRLRLREARRLTSATMAFSVWSTSASMAAICWAFANLDFGMYIGVEELLLRCAKQIQQGWESM